MTSYHIAQLNVGRAVAPLEHVVMADFMGWLDEINALAERSPGFVWRLQGDNGQQHELEGQRRPAVHREPERLDVDRRALRLHLPLRAQDRVQTPPRVVRAFGRPTTTLWWQPAGTVPSVDEALRRLECLRDLGPTPEAFTFKEPFAPADAVHDR